MGSEGRKSISRRVMLGAALGTAVGAIAQALGRPAPASAVNGDNMIVGNLNFESSRTAVYQTDDNSSEQALFAYTYGYGAALAATSVGGDGAFITGGGPNSAGVHAESSSGSTGVYGVSTNDSMPAPPLPHTETGVFGYASQQTSSYGVYGLSGIGVGVRGETFSKSGIGGSFAAPDGGGQAIAVYGRALFEQSGLAYVSAGHSYVDVSVTGGLVSASKVLATIQGYRPGVAVSSVRPRYPTSSKARIYLTKAVSSKTAVAWWVFG